MQRIQFTALCAVTLAPTVAFAAHPQGSSTGCPVEMVIVMDTSGSMSDEIGALCTDLSMIVAQLQQQNVNLTATFLGITATRDCLTSSVLADFGPQIPGNLACCPFLNHSESWGAGTAIVADRFAWAQNSIRLIVPISDEGPWRGGSSTCDADDQANIDNAIMIANLNQVVVAPIAGTGSPQCVIDLGARLAMGTGGESFVSTDPSFDLAGFIIDLTTGTCAGTGTISVACPGTGCPCGNDTSAPGEGCVNSTGLGGRMDWTGGTSVANNDLSLQLSNLPPGEFSMVVMGQGSSCSPLGDGLLGVDPGLPNPFIHFPVQSTGVTGDYSTGAGVAQDLAAMVNMAPLDLIGTTWRFQGVYRDQVISQSPCQTGFNLTNVVEVQFSN